MREEAPPFTADMMAAEARDTLSGWLQGYTEPDLKGEHPQRKIREMGCAEPDAQVFKVVGADHCLENDRYFKVEVKVIELELPPEGSNG